MMIKIKEFLKEFSLINLFRNNWQIKLISVLLAFVLWFVICEYVDPETTTWASDISIDVNEDSISKDANLGIMTVVDQTVDVRVSGSRDTIALMNRQKITAKLDLSKVTKSGEYDLPVLIDLGNQNLTIVEKSIETVRVRFDTLVVSNVKVNVKVEGDVPKGLIREEPIVKEGDYIVVKGPASIVETIVSAEVNIKQETFDKPGTFTCDYVFVDKDNKVIEKNFLSIDDNLETLTVEVPVVKEKMVPLAVEIVNSSGGSESTFCTAVILPKEIKISGSAETLDSYNAISLGTIDVAEKTESFETSMAIVLPNGIKNVDAVETAKVSIKFNDVQTRSFEVENIKLQNVPDGTKAKVSEKKISIKVRGIAEDINKLSAKDIMLVVDYAQADSAKGTKRMNAMVVFPKGLKVGAIGKYQLTVES